MKQIKSLLAVALTCMMVLPAFQYSVKAEGSQTNLALNKTAITVTPIDDYSTQIGWSSNTQNSSTDVSLLTNGSDADLTNWQSSTWFKMCRLSGREIVLDLGKVDTINSFSMSFAQKNSVGIYCPRFVKYYVSNDGTNYSFLGKADPDIPISIQSDDELNTGTNKMDKRVYTLNKISGNDINILGRYVKVVVPIDVFAWADELTVNGYEGQVNGAKAFQGISDPDEQNIVNKYPAPETSESAELKDQFLFYTGPYTSNPEITNWTQEKVAKILGYQDKNNVTKDWLFKSILVMPVGGFASTTTTKSTWTTFMDYMFADTNPVTQLKAMDAAAGDINAKLNTNNKVNVDIAIPAIKAIYTQSNFGDINDDGVSESLYFKDFANLVADPNSNEGRAIMVEKAQANQKLAVKWYIDEVIRRFNAAGFKNLQLKSFYWEDEYLNPVLGADEIVKYAADYLKQKGYYFTWIPYVGTSSPYLWKDLGFTTASMQPNTMFNAYKKSMQSTNANLAKKMGMSTEIEYGYGYKTNQDLVRRFAEYLNGGITNGYMTDTYHTYYMNTTSLVDVNESTNPVLRAVYDNTYNFIKGNYTRKFVMSFNTLNLTDKSNINVPVSVINADNFTEGSFEVLYDTSKVKYTNYALGAGITGNGNVNIEEPYPGDLRISFKTTDSSKALFGDITGKTTNKYTDIVNLKFAKLDSVADTDVTAKNFVIANTGYILDKDGNKYVNWSESDIITDNMKSPYMKASEALDKAEDSMKQEDADAARQLIALLNAGDEKDALVSRLAALQKSIIEGTVYHNDAALLHALELIADGTTIKVNIESNPVISKEVINLIKGREINVELNCGKITWQFKGSDIRAQAVTDLKLGLEELSESSNQKEKDDNDKKFKKKNADFYAVINKQESQLFCNVTVKIAVGTDEKDKYVNICEPEGNNEKGKVIESLCIGKDGTLTISTDKITSISLITINHNKNM